MELEIEGRRFLIPFEDLLREETEEDGMCFSGIQPNSASFMIIGDVFIKNNHDGFDQKHKRIGVTPLGLDKVLKTMNRHDESEAEGNESGAEGRRKPRRQAA